MSTIKNYMMSLKIELSHYINLAVNEKYKMIFIPLLITLAVEILVLILLKERGIKFYVFTFILNLITNTTLNITIQFVDIKFYYLFLIIFELLIVLLEGIGYYIFRKVNKDDSNIIKYLSYSLLCNVCSYFIGVILLDIFL